MVRRLLLTALLAALAVALPVAAEEDPAAAPGSDPSAPACPPLDLFCLPVVETWSHALTPAVEGSLPSDDESDCRVFDFSNDADPLHMVDPDGCWWRFVRRTLGIGSEGTLSFGGSAIDDLPLPLP